jgi:hypothetical protein
MSQRVYLNKYNTFYNATDNRYEMKVQATSMDFHHKSTELFNY